MSRHDPGRPTFVETGTCRVRGTVFSVSQVGSRGRYRPRGTSPDLSSVFSRSGLPLHQLCWGPTGRDGSQRDPHPHWTPHWRYTCTLRRGTYFRDSRLPVRDENETPVTNMDPTARPTSSARNRETREPVTDSGTWVSQVDSRTLFGPKTWGPGTRYPRRNTVTGDSL